jgi:Cys-tRNA(Pro) deacylase
MSDELPKATETVVEAGRRLGLRLEVREFPAGTRTAEDAARAIGCSVGQIVKSLVFVADTNPVLVLTSGSNRVDVVKVGEQTGASGVRKADAEEARAATGYAIGGTPPFGHDRDLPVLVDRDLTGFEVVWAAAGTPHHVFPITPADLVRVTGGRVADVALERT